MAAWMQHIQTPLRTCTIGTGSTASAGSSGCSGSSGPCCLGTTTFCVHAPGHGKGGVGLMVWSRIGAHDRSKECALHPRPVGARTRARGGRGEREEVKRELHSAYHRHRGAHVWGQTAPACMRQKRPTEELQAYSECGRR